MALKVLNANKHILNFKVRKKLCEAYIFSVLSYCNVIYYPFLTQADKQRLQRVQNNCCRFSYGLKKYDHISVKLAETRWLNVHSQYQYLLLVFVYKLLKTSQPDYLRAKLIFRNQIHSVPVRSNVLTMPLHRTTLFQRSITYNFVICYNGFHHHFVYDSLFVFRRNIKSILLNGQSRSTTV